MKNKYLVDLIRHLAVLAALALAALWSETASSQETPSDSTVPPAGQGAPEPGKLSDAKIERIHRNNRRKAEEKMARDSRSISQRDMADLEQTYQAANRAPRTPEAIEALEKVVKKYPKTNRAGCAALYLGRWTRANDQEKYLEMAIEKYSDCYYLDGTSVGGYGLLILGSLHKQAGRRTKAEKLFDEIRKDYADAQDHSGRLIVDLIPK